MSGMIGSLPKNLMKNSLIGAIVALSTYVSLQFLGALLIHTGVVGENVMYMLVCISAAVSAFAGCVVSVLRGEKESVLTSSAVVLIFLSLTVVIALTVGEVAAIGSGLTGVGAAMAVGGLLAAVVGGLKRGGGRTRRKTAGSRRVAR